MAPDVVAEADEEAGDDQEDNLEVEVAVLVVMEATAEAILTISGIMTCTPVAEVA